MDAQVVQWFVRWADYAQIVTPIIAVIGFMFLGKQITAANRQAQSANEQAKLTEEQVKQTRTALELSRNSFMPRLFINASYRKLSLSTDDGMLKVDYEGLALRIDNIGPGMGTCKVLTIRDDLSPLSSYDPIPVSKTGDWDCVGIYDLTRITDYSVGSGQAISFLLPWNNMRRLEAEVTTLSSLSLYYEDIYSRIFRSRIVLIWKHDSYGWHVEVIGRENTEAVELPVNPYSDTDVSIYSVLEGGKAIRDNPIFRVLHFDDSSSKLLNFPINGIPLTGDRPVTLLRYEFSHSGNPIYTLKVENFAEFKLSASRNNTMVNYRIDSGTPNEKVRLDTTGLSLTDDLNEQLRTLYNHITKEILGFLKTPIQRDYGQMIIL